MCSHLENTMNRRTGNKEMTNGISTFGYVLIYLRLRPNLSTEHRSRTRRSALFVSSLALKVRSMCILTGRSSSHSINFLIGPNNGKLWSTGSGNMVTSDRSLDQYRSLILKG